MFKRIIRSPLLQFLLLGLLALIAWRWLFPTPQLLVLDQSRLDTALQQWQQQLRAQPGARQMRALVKQQVRDEILFQRGLQRRLDLAPVVQRRLLNLSQFLDLGDKNLSDEALIEASLDMGLLHSDEMIRRYIVSSMEQLLEAAVAPLSVDEAAIEAYYQANQAEFIAPGRRTITHVYIGGQDQAAQQRAAELLTQIQADAIAPDTAILAGDNFYGGHILPPKSLRQLGSSMGNEFAEQVWQLPVQQWSPPLLSPYGWHLVWVHDKVDDSVKPLAQVRDAIVQQLQRQHTRAEVAQRLQVLEDGYQIIVPQAYAAYYPVPAEAAADE